LKSAARGGVAAGGYEAGEPATGGCCDATHATPKPRSRDTSRIAWAQRMAGEEFPLECPTCGGAIRLIAFHQSRGRSGRSLRMWENRSSRRRSRRPEARPPTGVSSSRSMTIAMRSKRRPTSCPRSTPTASDRCRTRGTHVARRRTGKRYA
jgi:hypothetical protein